MKKFYSLILVVLCGTAATFGQFAAHPVQKSKVTSSNFRKLPTFSHASAARHSNSQNHTASIIWTDDFSTPSNWSITHVAPTVSDWVIGTNGPSGPFAIPPIASTTAANGFAMFDSDLMCDATNGQIGDLTTVNPIDCSGHPGVRLSFQESYCRFYDSTYIYVSNNGTTWTRYEVNSTMVNNDFAGGGTASTGAAVNPYNVSLDISSAAGNQSTVYIRFEFYSPLTINALAGCAYALMIDDIVVDDLPADNAGMVQPHYPGPYTFIPLNQVQPIDLSAMVSNVGSNAETNVGFIANVYTWTGNVYNGTSTPVASMNPGDTSALLSAGSWTPADTGVYLLQYISYMDNTDADNTNDTLNMYIVVDDSTYARDYAYINGIIDGQPGFNGVAGSIAQEFDVYSPALVTSVSVWCHSTLVGDQISASVYSMSGGLPLTLLGSSAVYTTTASDTGGMLLTLEVSPAVNVGIGQMAVSFDQVSTTFIGLGFTHNVYVPSTAFFTVDGGATWGLTDTIGLGTSGTALFPGEFMIHPNLQIPSGIANANAVNNGYDVFPNPSNGQFYIHNNGQKENATVTVYNSVGQIVYVGTFTAMSNAMVDLSKQSAGVYSVQIKTEKEVITKSVVISNK